ncbi:hypothetical protein GCM10010981_04780 [Dyella nitratireducens]|uniref:Uncharacterized protein n=1 Tax=Dyella nitratireducens TaxID=1849580 RepID=A0ABQ1FMF3_9GAMM|nr:hypothetical protein GCM10010981_04780 [Dyella nitratireducens]GLQ44460.1 hypothetical protein GCM10007902_43100 [Dyella nitratireducens]
MIDALSTMSSYRPSFQEIQGYSDSIAKRIVIPAKAGIHRQYEAWIPAFAGMTSRSEAALS